MSVDLEAWEVENRRQLAGELMLLRDLVDAYAGIEAGEPAPAIETGGAPSALDRLCRVFGLTAFERLVILLCVGVELDGGFARSCAVAQGGKDVARPTVGLAMAALPEADWNALAPFSTLREAGLVTVTPSDEIVRSFLSVDEALLHYLLDGLLLDPELLKLGIEIAAPDRPPKADAAFAKHAATLWRDASRDAPQVLRLEGAAAAALRDYAALIASETEATAYRFEAAALPVQPAALYDLARRWRRFHLLHGVIMVVDLEDAAPEAQRAAERWADIVRAPMILIGEPPRPLAVGDAILLRAPRTTAETRIEIWRGALEEALGKAPSAAELGDLADRFRLPPDVVRAAARTAATAKDWRPALMETCRAHARRRLEGLAEWIQPHGGWSRLVLPDDIERPLREMAGQISMRDVVQRQWGVGGGVDRGLSTTALFAGPSGVGKTLAAEVIAAELGLDLYRIDLSSIVSKYIGETEKHLARLFDAAEGGGAVLLFDEADALFGKRSEVRDSHDRYANIEVGYLLQRLERYSGVAILTTNLRDSIDPAFLRRLRFVVDFPFPDETARARMWDLWLPAGKPRGTIQPEGLGRVALSGGQIFNVAVNASFLAAADGGPINAEHLLIAIRREYGKTGRAVSDSEARAVLDAGRKQGR